MRSHPFIHRRIEALACDGDGTLMRGKLVARTTARALERWRMSGRKLILVTGENEEELKDFPDVQAFDLIVAENGAALYWPLSRTAKRLAERCPPKLVRRLQAKGVKPLHVGETSVGALAKFADVVDEELRACGLDWQLITNRDQLIVLPRGVDKSTGLRTGLQELGLKRSSVVGVGDADNDIPLLACCGVGVAVHSATPSLKRHANHVARRTGARYCGGYRRDS